MLKPELIAMLVVAPLATGVVAAVCAAAASGRIRRNPLVGIRTPTTMRSDAAWRRAHAAAVRPASIWVAVLVVVEIVILVVHPRGLTDDLLAAALLVLLVAAVVQASVAALRAASRV